MIELGKKQVSPSLHSTSQSTINLANNPVFQDNTKHINVRYHFIRRFWKDSVLSLKKIYTSQNHAGMLTKMVRMGKPKTCSASVGLQE